MTTISLEQFTPAQRFVLHLANANATFVANRGRTDSQPAEDYEYSENSLWTAIMLAHSGLRLDYPPIEFDFFGLPPGSWQDHVTVVIQGDRVVAFMAEPYTAVDRGFDARMDRDCQRLGLTWSREPWRGLYAPRDTETIVVSRADWEEPESVLAVKSHNAIFPTLVEIVRACAP